MAFNPFEFAGKWITDHIKPYFMGIVALFCAFLLWAPKNWLGYFDLWEFGQNYRWAIALAFLFSSVVLIVELIRASYGWLKTEWDVLRWKRKQGKALEALPSEQLLILHDFVHNDRSAVNFQPHNGAIKDLEKNGFLYRSSEFGSTIHGFPYSIRPEIREIATEEKIQAILIARSK